MIKEKGIFETLMENKKGNEMIISRSDVMTIASSKGIRVGIFVGDRGTSHKFAFSIDVWKEGHLHTSIVSSNLEYLTKPQAMKAGEKAIKEVRAWAEKHIQGGK